MRIIKAGAVVEQARQRVALTAGEAVTRRCAAGTVALSVIGDSLDKLASSSRQRRRTAEMIVGEVVGGVVVCSLLPNLVVDAGAVQILDGRAVAVDVFDNILAVVNKIR